MAEDEQGTTASGTGTDPKATPSNEPPPPAGSGIDPSDIPPRDSTMKWEKPRVTGEPQFEITTKVIPGGNKEE